MDRINGNSSIFHHLKHRHLIQINILGQQVLNSPNQIGTQLIWTEYEFLIYTIDAFLITEKRHRLQYLGQKAGPSPHSAAAAVTY